MQINLIYGVLGKTGINRNFGLIKNRYYLEALYGWNKEEKYKFFDIYYKNVLEECTLKENADVICNKLKNEGNEIYFITARLENIEGCDTLKITKDFLDKNNIPYNELIIGAKDKITVCQDKKIELFIEDSYETCTELNDIGIKAILVTTKMNEKIESKNIPRANNWNEVYKIYKEI